MHLARTSTIAISRFKQIIDGTDHIRRSSDRLLRSPTSEWTPTKTKIDRNGVGQWVNVRLSMLRNSKRKIITNGTKFEL